MIEFLTDDIIIRAADSGARRFLNRSPRGAAIWIGDSYDVKQEGRLLALAFLRHYGNPAFLNPALISQIVFYDLIDLVRQRSKYRTLDPSPFWVPAEEALLSAPEAEQTAVDIRDVLDKLAGTLTVKESVTLDLFKLGFSQAEIARELNETRSCVSKRFGRIREKLAVILNA